MRLVLGLLLAMVTLLPMQRPQPGVWGAGAAYLWPGPTAIADYPQGGRSIDVLSPDGTLLLQVRESMLTVALAKHSSEQIGADIPLYSLAEVLWAPDSKAFALTSSDGGWVGSWSVVVYRVRGRDLEKVNIAEQAFAEFGKRTVARTRDCEVEEPNIGAVAWLDGSSRLLVLAEAPPHSSCCDMGHLQGYALEVPTGKILARYSQAELAREFRGRLGARFQRTSPAS